MRPFITIWVVILSWTISLQAQSGGTSSANTNSVSLEECIRQALEHNLRIQITRIDPTVSRYALDESYSIYDPRFESSYIHSESTQEADIIGGTPILANSSENDIFNGGFVGELPTGLAYDIGIDTVNRQETIPSLSQSTDNWDTDIGVNLRQPLLRDSWTSATRAQIRLSKQNLRISEKALELAMMLVIRDVQSAYYDLIAAQDDVKVRRKALELATQLFEENKKRVEAGVLARLDEKQAESEVATAQAALIAAESMVVKQENFLKNLISDNFEYWNPIRLAPSEKLLAVPESFNRPESWSKALEKRPDFQQLKYELEKQGIVVKLQYNQLFPTLDLVGSYGRAGLDTFFGGSIDDINDDNNPRHSYGIVLSVPLTRRAERSRYRSARETQRQLELQMKEMHQNIIVEVENAIIDAESFFQQIEARRQARLFAEAALDAEQKKLENGKSTSFFVLELQRNLTDARALEIRALADYNKSLSLLYYSEGTILERNNIYIEFR